MATKTYYDRGRFKVTAKAFRTKSKTFVISRLEKTSLRRPGLVFAAVFSAAVYGFSFAFNDIIFDHEWPYLMGPPLIAVLFASTVGTLSVHSKALGQDGAVIGFYATLRRVRAAIDQALEDHLDRSERLGKPKLAADDLD